MSIFPELSAAIGSAKVALDIVKSARELSNYNELVAAVSEVNEKLMQAHVVALASLEKQSSLTSEVAELKDKLRKIEDWECQMKRYEPKALVAGFIVYAVKPGMEQGEPTHYLCATCVGNRKKSYLAIRHRRYECPAADCHFVFIAPE